MTIQKTTLVDWVRGDEDLTRAKAMGMSAENPCLM